MLVLARQEDETILIRLPDGREISIKTVEIRGSTVRLGITAPKDISIHREELANDPRWANRMAVAGLTHAVESR